MSSRGLTPRRMSSEDEPLGPALRLRMPDSFVDDRDAFRPISPNVFRALSPLLLSPMLSPVPGQRPASPRSPRTGNLRAPPFSTSPTSSSPASVD